MFKEPLCLAHFYHMVLRPCIQGKKSATAHRIHALNFLSFQSANKPPKKCLHLRSFAVTLIKAGQEVEYMFALANDFTNMFLW